MIWAQLGMELCLASLALGLGWIAFAGGGWPAPPLAFAPAAVGLASARLFPDAWRRANWYDALRWTVALGWAAGCAIYAQGWTGASVVAGWNVAFMAGLLLFWRGWSLGEDGVDPRDVQGTVQIALVAAVALVAVIQGVAPGAGMLPGVGTLLFGLLGLGLARRAERRRPGAPPESDWLTLVAVLGVAILIVGGLLLLLATPDALTSLLVQLQAFGAWLFAPVAAFFRWLAGLFGGGGPEQGAQGLPRGSGPAPQGSLTPPNSAAPLWTDWLFTLLTVILPILMLAALFFFVGLPLLRRLAQVRPARAATAPVEREPGPPTSSVDRFSWRAWWRTLLGWLFGAARADGERGSDGGRATARRIGAAGAPEPRTVRDLYRTLLSASARHGFGRSAATTPNELRDRLTAARPRARGPLQVLTDLYARTRYGEEHPDRGDVARMRAAVDETVEELGRRAEEEQRR